MGKRVAWVELYLDLVFVLAVAQRLVFVVASVPTGVAAVALDPASTGDSTVFALSLAAIRVVLAVAPGRTGDRRVTRAYLVSSALFAISVGVPEPFRYVLWAIGIGVGSSAMLPERGPSEACS